MNIFALDSDPAACARAHVDKHVVKMIIETAQLLSTAHHILATSEFPAPADIYKATHRNHPSAVWVRQTGENYWWTFRLFLALLAEYEYRYFRQHASFRLCDSLAVVPDPLWADGDTLSGPLTPVTPAMPDDAKVFPRPATFDESVQNYRRYYRDQKSDLHVWTRRPKPEWI